MKYSLGDKVKITNIGHKYSNYVNWVKSYAPHKLDSYNNETSMTNNSVAKVVAKGRHGIRDINLYLIEKDNSTITIGEDGIILASNQFDKSDLETGMVVKIRNGDTFLVLVNTIGFKHSYKGEALIMHDEYGILPLSEYSNDFEFEGDDNLDIVEVRRLNSINEMFGGYEYEYLEILWQRNEDIMYVKGFLFGSEVQFTWRKNGVECNEGDIVEVQTSSGLQLVKVKEVFETNSIEMEEQISDDNIVIRKIEY